MDLFLSFVSSSGAWVLALMGIVMSLNPPSKKDRRRWIWFISFAAVGLMVGGSQFWSAARDRAAQETFERKLTGADNYCYFQADLNRPTPNGGYEWQLINKNRRPIPNLQICLYLNGDFTRCWDQGMCIPHAIDQAKAEGSLTLGEHRFEFFGANSWSQTLKIYMDGENVRQRGEVVRGGEVIGKVPEF